MRSPLLTLCAAAAACAVTAAPAYGGEVSGSRSGTTRVAPVPAAPGCPVAPQAPGCGPLRAPARPTSLAGTSFAAAPFAPLALPQARPAAPGQAAPRRELSSTSAVGLVLAGGAVLVIAGQLLRLRLRLRRERQGDADEQ
ncbi:hypothetical protein [Streptomyces sp. NPDC020742]|uniref:hypothetical protein n=1 Tax=unclassified Streptomyces TaxID=2593676 RepID=UPI0033DA4661